jgi:beta-lactamase superfamily II metal-dependent hydrolase
MSLTKSDLSQIKHLLDNQEESFDTKIVEVKNDFYNKIDPILKEVTASQEERTILSHRVSDHEDRIEKVEKKLDIQPAI